MALAVKASPEKAEPKSLRMALNYHQGRDFAITIDL